MTERVSVVGSAWPWMRQGWTFLEDPVDVETTLILPGLADLVPRLTRNRFATLDAEGGQRLATLFGLQRRFFCDYRPLKCPLLSSVRHSNWPATRDRALCTVVYSLVTPIKLSLIIRRWRWQGKARLMKSHS